jgi:hypothetical protein
MPTVPVIIVGVFIRSSLVMGSEFKGSPVKGSMVQWLRAFGSMNL